MAAMNINKEEIKETIDETVKNVTETAEKTTKAVRKTAKKVADDSKKTAKKLADDRKKAVSDIKDEVEQVKKTARKKAVKGSVTVQFWGKDIECDQLLLHCKEIWVNELGKTASSFKEAKVYLKPEENTAYYVINDEVTGSFTL